MLVLMAGFVLCCYAFQRSTFVLFLCELLRFILYLMLVFINIITSISYLSSLLDCLPSSGCMHEDACACVCWHFVLLLAIRISHALILILTLRHLLNDNFALTFIYLFFSPTIPLLLSFSNFYIFFAFQFAIFACVCVCALNCLSVDGFLNVRTI